MTEPFELAVRGGTVIGPYGRRRVDLYASGGRIRLVLPPDRSADARQEVDASGLWVLPGFVDTHVHLMDPGDDAREDFLTGTRAAARSGVTTIIEHTHSWPVTTVDRLEEKLSHLRGRSFVDYGLAAHAWTDNLVELPDLWRRGIAFVKAFTCETHGVPATAADVMLDLLRTQAGLGAPTLIHCEDDLITAANERRLRAAGRLDGGIVPEWRSREAEQVAVASTALLARVTGARVTVAHVSGSEALELVEREAAAGAPIVAETCPQYLTLREAEVLDVGALRKFTPPARLRSDGEERQLWDALDSGRFTVLSSDHAPSTRAQKEDGDIWSVHFGLPGLDTTSSILLDAAIEGRIALERVVRVYSAGPACRYGLAGKGSLDEGSDADMVLVDPGARRVLTDEDVWSKAGWTPYGGRAVRGAPVATILGGRPVVVDGQLVDDEPRGRFVPGGGVDSDAGRGADR